MNPEIKKQLMEGLLSSVKEQKMRRKKAAKVARSMGAVAALALMSVALFQSPLFKPSGIISKSPIQESEAPLTMHKKAGLNKVKLEQFDSVDEMMASLPHLKGYAKTEDPELGARMLLFDL